MNLLSLYYFVELAKELHVTNTTQKLYISQQNLSQHIQRLEQYYGVPLFHRKPKLALTYAGEQLYAVAVKILAEEHEFQNRLADISEKSIGNLKLDDSFIRTPEGAAYDAGLKGVAVGGKVVTGKVAIAPLIKYGIKVAGVEVTNLNCADLSMIDGVSGTISFDPATSTMTMQDVTLERTEEKDGVGISNRSCKDFKLNLIGQNIIRTYFSSLLFNEPSIISGSGVVHASSSFGGGIYVDNATLTIDDCEVYANGAYGIAGAEERKDNKVVIRNAYVKLEGTEATMSWIDGFTLESCSIKEPEGVAYDATLR